MKTQTRELDLKLVVPDENQPRKLFEPTKLKNLKESVKKYGVMTPITVEEISGKYLIVDGERRYRVAKELGLATIPGVVIAPQNAVDRLVQQFHIQEQREDWTPVEKAITVHRLASELGISLKQICELLALDERTGQRYIAFSNIIDKEKYHQSEIGIQWAEYIIGVKTFAKKLAERDEESWTKTDEKRLENNLITRIKEGEFARPAQMSKIKDIFSKNPKLVKELTGKKETIDEMFVQTKAKAAFTLRNLANACGYVKSHGAIYLAKFDIKPTQEQMRLMKKAHSTLEDIIKKVGDDMLE